MTHECDGQTDRRTDVQTDGKTLTITDAALHYVGQLIMTVGI